MIGAIIIDAEKETEIASISHWGRNFCIPSMMICFLILGEKINKPVIAQIDIKKPAECNKDGSNINITIITALSVLIEYCFLPDN